MNPPTYLAHGALGPFDEIIFLSIFMIFIVMMGVAWVRSRAVGDRDLEDSNESQPNVPAQADDSADRYTLE